MSDRVMGSAAVVAVGRFRPGGPIGYRAATMPNAPLRATREDAVQDERFWLDAAAGIKVDRDGRVTREDGTFVGWVDKSRPDSWSRPWRGVREGGHERRGFKTRSDAAVWVVEW